MSKEPTISRRRVLAAAGAAGLSAIAADTAFPQDKKKKEPVHADKRQVVAAANWQSSGPFATAEAAAAFLNVEPDQGPGEASICAHGGEFWVLWYH